MSHLREEIEKNPQATIDSYGLQIYFEGSKSLTKSLTTEIDVERAVRDAAEKGISVEFIRLKPGSLLPDKFVNANSLEFQNATIVEYMPTDFSEKSSTVMVAAILAAMTFLGMVVAVRRTIVESAVQSMETVDEGEPSCAPDLVGMADNKVGVAECDSCRAVISADSQVCPECNTSFKGVAEVVLGECGACESLAPLNSTRCPECNVEFVDN